MPNNFQSFKQGGYVGQGNTAKGVHAGYVIQPRKIQVTNSLAKSIMQALINSSQIGSNGSAKG